MTTPWQDYTLKTESTDAQKARDLDETRRLLYTALCAQTCGRRAELAGTIINALAHHGAGIGYQESWPHVVALVDEAAGDSKSEYDARGEARQWVREQIAKITELLDG